MVRTHRECVHAQCIRSCPNSFAGPVPRSCRIRHNATHGTVLHCTVLYSHCTYRTRASCVVSSLEDVHVVVVVHESGIVDHAELVFLFVLDFFPDLAQDSQPVGIVFVIVVHEIRRFGNPLGAGNGDRGIVVKQGGLLFGLLLLFLLFHAGGFYQGIFHFLFCGLELVGEFLLGVLEIWFVHAVGDSFQLFFEVTHLGRSIGSFAGRVTLVGWIGRSRIRSNRNSAAGFMHIQ
mmetsp:Transcript_12754/g.36016  ORF Transcript_12754/g.36016 Transcript_12754/m.36016 type:complete len:233 (-) Transcript_12754:2066-2764(-)